MNHPILYYPYFEPKQKWLRSVLLFTDEIHRIIPEQARHVDSENTQRLLEIMPNALKTIAPSEDDKFFDDLNFQRLEKAFQIMRDEADGTPYKSISFLPTPNGTVRLQGNTWLSNAKLQERVKELLLKYKLADEFTNPFTGSRPFGDTFPANEEAANLIVSYIADRIARRTGLNTVTSVAIPNAVQSLDALQASTASLHREGEGLLASAVANLVIPDGIEKLTVHQYHDLRQSFQEIREPFHELISSLSRRSNLERQQSAMALEIRLERAIGDYKDQMAKYMKTAHAKAVDKWIGISFQGLLSIAAVFATPAAQAVIASGIVAVEIMKNISTAPEMEHEKTFRMLCQLGKQVDQQRLVSGLV